MANLNNIHKISCPFCKQDNTRFQYEIFHTEIWLCLDCLKSFSIEFNPIEHSPRPQRA
jgi:transposase-like protein